jgi:hypothetical protein
MEHNKETAMKNKLIFILAGVSIFALFVFGVFVLAKSTQAGREPPLPEANSYAPLINSLEQELSKNDLSPEAKKDILGRIDLLGKLATQQAEGYKNSAPRDSSVMPTNLPQTNGKIPDGIEANPSAPFRQTDIIVSNAWRKTFKDIHYLIYAGRLSNDSKQGVVMVFHSDTNNFVIYRTPEIAGNVSIISEKDLVLELNSESGAIFYFTVVQEAYIVDGKLVKVEPGAGEKSIETPYPAP